jgi:hypothetical protein
MVELLGLEDGAIKLTQEIITTPVASWSPESPGHGANECMDQGIRTAEMEMSLEALICPEGPVTRSGQYDIDLDAAQNPRVSSLGEFIEERVHGSTLEAVWHFICLYFMRVYAYFICSAFSYTIRLLKNLKFVGMTVKSVP